MIPSLLLAGSLFFLAAAPEAGVGLHEEPITDYDRDHWSFRPLVRPEPPTVGDEAWVHTPIDRFILAKLEAEKLAPMPEAEAAALLRRVTFDLTGLPPTPEELDAFLQSAIRSPQSAIETVVDRLLASPAYGERWGQHWLDMARFAETDGFEHDKVRPDAWRYRDWVIDALNRDLPFDEFVRLQLAGDELRSDDREAAIATGFLLAGPDMPDLNIPDERRHNVLNEMTSTVGAVFLGLQLGCAQCHDHKYDPLSQADFYRLRAVFETADLFKSSNVGRVLREKDSQPPVSHLMVRGDFRRPGAVVEAAFPRIANRSDDKPPTALKPDAEAPSGRRTALAKWLTRPDHPLLTRVAANWIWQHHFGEGLSRTPGDFGLMGDTPSHPELLDWLATELVREQWSLKKLHKLMVMSAVYRTASRPASPEWNDAQTAAAQAAWDRLLATDAPNRLLGRSSRRRLEGEAIRDAMLASADRLSPRKGGPGIMAPLPAELTSTILKGQWKTAEDPEDHRRRSIYLFVRRNLRYPLFDVFDRPDTNSSCPRRYRSTTAPQALVLLNSEQSLAAARDLAGFVMQHADDSFRESESNSRSELATNLLWQRTLSRQPTAVEQAAAREFLKAQTTLLQQGGRKADDLALPTPLTADAEPHAAAALVDLCLAMFNLNEFVYVD